MGHILSAIWVNYTSALTLIKRYLVTPLLTLRDVGAYGLALAGIPFPSTTLEGLGLRDATGRPQPLPDEATILAIASQRAAATGTGGLTPEGWQRVGVAPLAAPTASATPLFFVPPEVIGGLIGNPAAPLIGNLIGLPAASDTPDSASGGRIPANANLVPASHGSDLQNESNPPIPVGGGGSDLLSQDSAPGGEEPPTPPPPPQARRALPLRRHVQRFPLPIRPRRRQQETRRLPWPS